MTREWEKVGGNDLRVCNEINGGFRHLVLRDEEDGGIIVVMEDDLISLRDLLNKVIQEEGLE